MAGDYLNRLNPAQLQAVTHGDGPLLIVAGAGTGKTMTLACRVAYLIDRGVQPERILLLTFTRRAAAEMLRRAGEMAGRQITGRVWGGTFHATANRLLRIYGQALGLAPDFTILDQADAADLMNLVRSELGFGRQERGKKKKDASQEEKKRRFPKKETLVAAYSRTVAAREKLGDVLRTRFPWCVPEMDNIRRVFERYVERKREQGLLDYDDLLLHWHLLCNEGAAGRTVTDRFDHVLVDEYQDTNTVQCDILRAMRRFVPNICVVGDDAQSIYSFRAATVRNILDFPEHFPGAAVVKLEQNYRSTQPILAASNAVMASARERYTKELWSQRVSEQKPILVHCSDEDAQCNLVCDTILQHLEEGIPLMRQAVLFRAGHHSGLLEVELSRRNVPFHKYGGLKFIESAHVKDMLALLRILENPNDQVAWYRVLLMLDGVGPATARRVIDGLNGALDQAAAAEGKEGDAAPVRHDSPLHRLLNDPPRVPAAARESFEALRDMVRQCGVNGHADEEPEAEAKASGPTVAAQVELARQFYEPIFERRYDDAVMRIRDLEELEHIAAGYRSRRRFLADLTLDPPTSTSDLAGRPFLDEDYLILSTIHSAKGCEWDVVHIIHAADGMIPSDMALTDEAGLEEERRLLYVAMTRARDMLYVYFPLRYYHRRWATGDRHSYAQLTRFIGKEMREHFEQRAPSIGLGDDKPASVAGGRDSVDRWLKDLWKE